jgi:flagellar motility protein MotE (MotC chaperone)
MNGRVLATALALATIFLLTSPCGEVAAQEEEQQFSSVEERRLTAALEEQRESLRREREELALRQKELKSLNESVDKKLAEIDEKLVEMQKLRRELDRLLAAKSAEEQKRIGNLAGIYEKMLPEKAAPALAGLDQILAADLLAAMKPKAAAKILDEIARQKASELSTTFSTPQLE